jgi:hypothetical protein
MQSEAVQDMSDEGNAQRFIAEHKTSPPKMQCAATHAEDFLQF